MLYSLPVTKYDPFQGGDREHLKTRSKRTGIIVTGNEKTGAMENQQATTDQAKRGRGRPPKGQRAATGAARVRAYRERRYVDKGAKRVEVMLESGDLKRLREIGVWLGMQSYPKALAAAVAMAVSSIPAAQRRDLDLARFSRGAKRRR